MANDRSHNNDNDTPGRALAARPTHFFRLQNDLMAAHPLQVAMQAGKLTIHPRGRAGSALFALLLEAANGLCRPAARLHNIIFHIVRSLACHFLHYVTVCPVQPAAARAAGLIPPKARTIRSTIFSSAQLDSARAQRYQFAH